MPISEPTGIPLHRGEYIRLMGGLIAVAFQQDLTIALTEKFRWRISGSPCFRLRELRRTNLPIVRDGSSCSEC